MVHPFEGCGRVWFVMEEQITPGMVCSLLGMFQPIDIEVSRWAIVCPCLFRNMILCYSPSPNQFDN